MKENETEQGYDLRAALNHAYYDGYKASEADYKDSLVQTIREAKEFVRVRSENVHDLQSLKDEIYDLIVISANLLVGGPENNNCLMAADGLMRSVIWGDLGRKLEDAKK